MGNWVDDTSEAFPAAVASLDSPMAVWVLLGAVATVWELNGEFLPDCPRLYSLASLLS
jgi:hypothetical protein